MKRVKEGGKEGSRNSSRRSSSKGGQGEGEEMELGHSPAGWPGTACLNQI